MDFSDKQFFVKSFRKKITEKLPEVRQLGKDINYMKFKTYKQKGYVPHYKLERNNRLIRLLTLPVKDWQVTDFKNANEILKWYKI